MVNIISRVYKHPAVFILTAVLFLITPVYTLAQAPSGDIVNTTPTSSVCFDNLGSAVSDSAVCKAADQGNDISKDPFFGPDSLLGRITQLIVFLVGAASVIMIIVGGFRYVVSGGDSGATKSAKDTILYAVIGLVIAVFAQLIVSFVLTRKFF